MSSKKLSRTYGVPIDMDDVIVRHEFKDINNGVKGGIIAAALMLEGGGY